MSEQRTDVAESDTISYARAADLSDVRAFVATHASTLGLPEVRVELLTVAISELATNTLQHTTGGGSVRIYVDGGQVVCDVVDGGSLGPRGRLMPAADALRGRGLAIVERVCDVVDVAPVAGGTLVRVRLNL